MLAGAAARTGAPFAAGCVEVHPGDAIEVTRQRWAGSVLEDAGGARRTGLPGRRRARRRAAPVRPSRRAVRIATHTPDVARDGPPGPARRTRRPDAGADLPGRCASRRGWRPRRRRTGGIRGPRRAGGAPRWGRRGLAGGRERRLASPRRPGRPDGHPDRAGPLHRLRHQRGNPAHRRLPSPRRSWRSTPIPTRRSWRRATGRSSATCTRSCRRSPQRSAAGSIERQGTSVRPPRDLEPTRARDERRRGRRSAGAAARVPETRNATSTSWAIWAPMAAASR